MKKEEIQFAEIPKISGFRNVDGKTSGKLLVLGYAGKFGKGIKQCHYWYCECECGYIVKIPTSTVNKGRVGICWCTRKSVGMDRTPERYAYDNAKSRCNNPDNDHYPYYGARGIQFRYQSFEEFYNDLGNRPSEKYTLERIDTDGHYEKGNCRWATWNEQYRNMRRNRFLNYNGERHTLAEWGRKSKFSNEYLVKGRIQAGWCMHCAMTIPINKKRRKIKTCLHKP